MSLLKLLLALSLACVTPLGALAQVRQSGNVTPTHVACWTTNGTIQDCGASTSPYPTTFGVVNGTGVDGVCVQSAVPPAAGYQRACLGATTAGGASLSVQNFGTAPPGGFAFSINGVVQGLPTVSLPTVSGDAACFNSSTGSLIDCGFSPGQPGRVVLQRISNPSFEVSTWAAYNQAGQVVCSTAVSVTTTGCLAEAATVAFPVSTSAPAGYVLEVLGGMDPAPGSGASPPQNTWTSGGAVVIPMSRAWTLPVMQLGKLVVKSVSLDCPVVFDSIEGAQIDFEGSQASADTSGACLAPDTRSALIFNPTTASPIDKITAITPTTVHFQALNGGWKVTGGMMQWSDVHLNEVNAGSAPTPITTGCIVSVDTASAASFDHNTIRINFLHGLNTAGMTGMCIGTAGESGGHINGFNTYEVGLGPDIAAGTPAVAGVVTWGHNDTWRIHTEQMTSATTVIQFNAGACGNLVFIEGLMPASPFIDNGNCLALSLPQNTIFVNGVLATGGITVNNTTPAFLGAGTGSLGATASIGVFLRGQGSVTDFTLENKNGAGVCSVTTGTTTLTCTAVTTALVAGGTATNSELRLQSTASGAPSGDFVSFYVNGAEQQRLLSGHQLVGATSAQTMGNVGSINPFYQLYATGPAASFGFIRQTTPGGGGALFAMGASRSTPSTGSYSALQSGDGLGSLIFVGDTGVTLNAAGAGIAAQATALWTASSSPAMLALQTTASGSTGASINAVLAPNGAFGIGNFYTASNLPNFKLGFDHQASETIGVERNTTTTGNSLTISSGGALSGGSNLAGGNLALQSGISTGSGTSDIVLSTFPGVAGATSDNTLTEVLRLVGASSNVKFSNAGSFTANGTGTVTITNVLPNGHTATIAKWLTIIDSSGTTSYLPVWQ